MNRQLIMALGALLSVCPGLLRGGEPQQVQLKWSELSPRITDKKVALVLPGGTHIEGKVRAVTQDGLHLRVSSTSDRNALPKGEQVIPRPSVSVLRVTEYRKLGRLLTVAGTLGVAGAIVAANYPDLYEGPAIIAVPAATAAGMAGLGVGSYYAGKRIDRKVTEIRVAREDAAAGR